MYSRESTRTTFPVAFCIVRLSLAALGLSVLPGCAHVKMSWTATTYGDRWYHVDLERSESPGAIILETVLHGSSKRAKKAIHDLFKEQGPPDYIKLCTPSTSPRTATFIFVSGNLLATVTPVPFGRVEIENEPLDEEPVLHLPELVAETLAAGQN